MAEITHFLLLGQQKDRRVGFGLTIAAWTDINLCKLVEVSILLCYWGMSSIPGHPFNSITHCSSANNPKSSFLCSLCLPPAVLQWAMLLYLHSRLTSRDVFTWEMCNTTPWFTGEDNPCFRQGEAVIARGVGFPFLLFTERGRVLLRSAWLQSPSYMSTDWSARSQTAGSCTHSRFLYFFLGFLSARSLWALFLPSLHCIWFHLSLSPFPPYTSSFSYPVLSHYLSGG